MRKTKLQSGDVCVPADTRVLAILPMVVESNRLFLMIDKEVVSLLYFAVSPKLISKYIKKFIIFVSWTPEMT